MVPSAAPDHDTPTTMLDCRQDTLVFVLLTWLPPHTLDIVIHVLSLLVFSKLFAGFLCIIFRRGFLLGRQPCRPICCSMRLMVWALTGWPPTPSTSAAMLASNLCIWRWACALNFFGRPWRGLFWVEPVPLNRCMVLATVLQLSFRVLAIFL